MTKTTGPTNPNLKDLIRELKTLSAKENVKIWKAVAKNLEKPARRKKVVNIFKINKYTRDGETAVVPGKVLSLGELKKNIKVAAFQFSDAAKEKIKNMMSIQQLIKENPKGKRVRIIK